MWDAAPAGLPPTSPPASRLGASSGSIAPRRCFGRRRRGCASTRAATLLVLADAAALPFRRAFDAVFSGATFHWIHDHDALFRAIITRSRRADAWSRSAAAVRTSRSSSAAPSLMRDPAFLAVFEGWTDPEYFADVASTTRRLTARGIRGRPRVARARADAVRRRGVLPGVYRDVCVRHHVARLPAEERTVSSRLTLAAAAAAPAFTLDYWRLNVSAKRPAERDPRGLVWKRGSRSRRVTRDASVARVDDRVAPAAGDLASRRRAIVVGMRRRRGFSLAATAIGVAGSRICRPRHQARADPRTSSPARDGAPAQRPAALHPARARLEGAAGGAGRRPARPDAHPYALDLDLFGHASLYEVAWSAGDDPRRGRSRSGSSSPAARRRRSSSDSWRSTNWRPRATGASARHRGAADRRQSRGARDGS